MRKPKILILFCGGTIIMRRGANGSLVVKEKEQAIKSILELEPRIHELAQVDVEFIANVDSTNITLEHWNQMTRAIERAYDQYDGFVITHGTDTMAYTASALTFSLQGIGKPVVLTGAQIPGDAIESDARNNLVNSIRVALMDLSGVYIVFHDKIVLGARSSKASESRLDAFATKNAPDIGEIRTEIRLWKHIPKRHEHSWEAKPGFENDILVITIVPGRNVFNLVNILQEKRTKGMLIRAYSTGNIPDEFLPVLQAAHERHIPIVITSQCLGGSTQMDTYEVGKKALEMGAVQLYDMSLECATTKFMWALANFSYAEIGAIMQRNFIGEINTDGQIFG